MNKFTKVIKVILNTLMTIIIILGILFLLLYAIGIRPFVVESGSMEPNIHVGSVCFVNKRAKFENIKQNDVIAFNTKVGMKVTHRAINITQDGIETKGDANEHADGQLVTKNLFIGKTLFSVPKAGYFIRYIQSPKGMIIFGIIILVIVLLDILVESNDKSAQDGKNSKGKHSSN